MIVHDSAINVLRPLNTSDHLKALTEIRAAAWENQQSALAKTK